VSAASDSADVSAESEGAAVTEQTDDAVSGAGAEAHTPVIQILKGRPTDEDLAALVTVFAGASGSGPADPGPQERDLWGHPVDKLRYSISSLQRVTLVERLHIRR
jgi:hypothetical protein